MTVNSEHVLADYEEWYDVWYTLLEENSKFYLKLLLFKINGAILEDFKSSTSAYIIYNHANGY